jgi:TolB-like protein/DNA-binding winged helix-turn-helix (wHTH) protein/Tfp pilus assembly protein PilF
LDPAGKDRPLLRFGLFELDVGNTELRKAGVLIKLPPQPFRILVLLASSPGQVLTREEIQRQIWGGGTFVDFEQGLNFAIKKVREAIGDDAQTPRYIETLPRRGYRFIAPVSAQPGRIVAGSPAADAADAIVADLNGVPALTDKVMPLPTRRTRPLGVPLLIGLLMVLVCCVWYVALLRKGSAGPLRIRSVVVLPLRNLAGGPEQEYFVDWMTDELITDLAKLGPLRVISVTSSMRYKGGRKRPVDVARELNVDAVVEGSVLRSADRIRITAQLIDASTDRHIWAESYERDVRDVFALQNEVCMAIARRIQIEITPQEQARFTGARPVSPRAHEAYLQGRYFLARRTHAGLKKSVGYFRQAIEIDSRYALAFAGLADAYDMLGGYELIAPREALPEARAAANAALAIDDTLVEAHTALGFAASILDFDRPTADREFKRAFELNPNYATAYHWYAEYQMSIGQPQAAIVAMERARELDPVSLVVNMTLGRMCIQARYYDRGIEQCRKALELDTTFAAAHWCIGLGYVGKKMYHQAVGELLAAEALGELPLASGPLGYAYALAGDTKQARNVLRRLLAPSPDSYRCPYEIAIVYAGLGEKDHAFEWLNKALEERDLMLANVDPFLDGLRSDPRFRQLMRRSGLLP